MALVKTWYTVEEAVAKYGFGREQIMEWVEEGLVRYERDDGRIARVNIDDVELQAEAVRQDAEGEG